MIPRSRVFPNDTVMMWGGQQHQKFQVAANVIDPGGHLRYPLLSKRNAMAHAFMSPSGALPPLPPTYLECHYVPIDCKLEAAEAHGEKGAVVS